MKKTSKSEMSCPCGSGKSYELCCGQYIRGKAWPEKPADLMRSRYTAYTLNDEPYLLRTWHATTRPAELGLGESNPIKWIGLSILGTEAGEGEDTHGTVEFEARYKVNGKAEKMHEKSRFVKEDGIWYYLDGEIKEQESK